MENEFTQAVSSLTEDVIKKLQTAVEIGRWENGEKLTPNQLESAMQAVMIWQSEHCENDAQEPFIVGPEGKLYTGKGGVYQPTPASTEPLVQKITIKEKLQS